VPLLDCQMGISESPKVISSSWLWMITKSSDLVPCQNQSLFLIIEESYVLRESRIINHTIIISLQQITCRVRMVMQEKITTSSLRSFFFFFDYTRIGLCFRTCQKLLPFSQFKSIQATHNDPALVNKPQI
jgi:hypothetical protein